MVIEWMVATGNAIPEIVNSWSRTKFAQPNNLHIGNYTFQRDILT